MAKINLDDYVKVERDVNGGEILNFLNDGNWIESKLYKNPDGSVKMNLEFSVEFNGEKKKITLNKTSQKNLVLKWGKDTTEWIGKQAKVVIGMTPQGRKCIFLEAKE